MARALRARATVIVFELRFAGGDSSRAIELGRYISSINDDRPDDPVETIAFVTSVARNLAAFPAFGCNQIVMQRKPAGADPSPEDEDDSSPARPAWAASRCTSRRTRGSKRILGDNLAEIAARQLYPAAVARALTRADLQVVLVEPTAGAGGRAFLTKEEYETRPEEVAHRPLGQAVGPAGAVRGPAVDPDRDAGPGTGHRLRSSRTSPNWKRSRG